MQPIIQAEHVSFSYGKHAVLKELSLTINPGEIIGLIGKNGAEKTTLLNLLLGIRANDSGYLTLFDEVPGGPLSKQNIGSMLQGDLPIRGVTVSELLTMAAAHYSTALQPNQLMRDLALTELAHRRLTALSGGELRRVTFALALIGNPQLLFLDEPTVGMDTNAQQAFWERIKSLKAQGKTVIMTTHYLPEIEQVADRIFLLQGGQLAFKGTFTELQRQYQQVEISFRTALALTTFESLAGVTAATQVNHVVHISSTEGDQTLQALVPYLSQLHQVTLNRESLATIFVHLTKEG